MKNIKNKICKRFESLDINHSLTIMGTFEFLSPINRNVSGENHWLMQDFYNFFRICVIRKNVHELLYGGKFLLENRFLNFSHA